MKTFWDPPTEQELLTRVRSLRPDLQPRWGRFSCAQMVVHVTDAFALYMGELGCNVKWTPARYPPLKQALVYVMPFPGTFRRRRNCSRALRGRGRTKLPASRKP